MAERNGCCGRMPLENRQGLPVRQNRESTYLPLCPRGVRRPRLQLLASGNTDVMSSPSLSDMPLLVCAQSRNAISVITPLAPRCTPSRFVRDGVTDARYEWTNAQGP
ncbi:hypothetical protein ACFFX0_29330 [Citricoccus parietis]|uniref:Uncharacterized protein n=1 Tax=Citricoccus parietis TaxID=592307 RepID=A0ABV5G7X7_9MICC